MMTADFKDWKCTDHNVGGIPVEFKRDENGFSIIAKDGRYSGGRWESIKDEPDTRKSYSFIIGYRKESKNCKVAAVIHQVGENGEYLLSDYFLDNGKGSLELTVEIIEECRKLHLVMFFLSYGEGKCEFFYPKVQILKKSPHRIINVATSYFERKWYKRCEDNIPHILKIIENASSDENKPAVLCFTETTYDRGILLPLEEKAVNDNSRIIEIIKEKAKEKQMYMIFGVHESDEERMYNTAYIISDCGEIIGKYRKTHFTYTELLSEMTPGEEIPVFDLPFGKIGIMICWDQWFPEMARALSEKGAEIIFVLTAGNPECLSRARAYENGVFVVVSGCEDGNPGASFIVDQYGEILGAVESDEKGYISLPIDLDARKHMRYLSFPRGYGADIFKTENRKDLYNK